MKKNKFKIPFLLAITGGFGTGKSSVGNMLRRLKILVVDTDVLVRDILNNKNKVTEKIVKYFGREIANISANEYINRRRLAEIVFNEPYKRKKLESIIHPEVRSRLSEIIKSNRNKKIIAVLIPLLFESKMQKYYDEIWCVVCKRQIQVKRLKKKGFSLDEIKARINSQLPQIEKAKLSHYIIDNSGTIINTKKQVLKRLKLLVRLNHNLHLSCDI